MTSMKQIRSYADRVAREFRPQRVVLFGSHAYGQPSRDSDVDILVVMDSGDEYPRASVRIRQRLHADFPMDLIVRSPAKVEERVRMGDPFMQEILSKGKVLYEAPDV